MYNIKKRTLFSILISAIIIIAFFMSIRLYLGEFNPVYVVVSGSMIPTLQIGDVVVTQNDGHGIGGSAQSAFDHLKKGDIIVFKAPDDFDEQGNPRTIVHRVIFVGLEPRSNEQVVATKGDNNPESYLGLDFPIMKSNYIGKVIIVIPKLGLIIQLLKPPVNYILIAIIIGVFIVYHFKRERKGDASSTVPATS
ncbi:MAG: signal peptidase I [Thermoproteota archaeon]|nr:signal peptidase I [Thermoproteota archaeon]